MSELTNLFLKRIGLTEQISIDFQTLDRILEQMAFSIPFENLAVIRTGFYEMNQENLIQKILIRNEGGLCYELNALLYLFLRENGFDVVLISGEVFHEERQDWDRLGGSHVFNLVTYKGQKYLVDSGFGGNLPLKPVPLTGETVTSLNGLFRVEKKETEFGKYLLKMKLRDQNRHWKWGYAFNTNQQPVKKLTDLNEVQKTIIHHPDSPFNQSPLVIRLTPQGKNILTASSFTKTIAGKKDKVHIQPHQFQEIAKNHFGLNL